MTDEFLPGSEEYPEPVPVIDPSDGAAGEVVLAYEMPAAEAPLQSQPAAKPKRSFFGGLWAGRRTRIDALSHAIEMNPEEPANYILRGELYYQLREYALAEVDFQRGYILASEQVEANRWGIVAQTLLDRALYGLTKVQRRLAGQASVPDM